LLSWGPSSTGRATTRILKNEVSAPVAAASSHQNSVQFFDSHQTAATALAEFVRAGLARNERIVVIARLADWNRAAVDLSRDVALSEAIGSGRLTVCDSTRTLDAISVNGWPSPERFDRVVGTMIAAAHAGGSALRAYGDMVDVLAADGRCDAAARLEELERSARACAVHPLLRLFLRALLWRAERCGAASDSAIALA